MEPKRKRGRPRKPDPNEYFALRIPERYLADVRALAKLMTEREMMVVSQGHAVGRATSNLLAEMTGRASAPWNEAPTEMLRKIATQKVLAKIARAK